MGIAAFLSTGNNEVLKRLPTEIFNLWLDVFGEVKEAQNISNYSDSDECASKLSVPLLCS
jgi:hypothetical protein